MIVNCQNCSTRLQLDDAKVPSRPFSVRCPKCRQIINAQPGGTQPAQKDALSAVTDLPASTRSQKEINVTSSAPIIRGDAPPPPPPPSSGGDGEILRMLAALLRQNTAENGSSKGTMRGGRWENRRVLVCVGPTYCEEVVAALTANQYVVYIAESAEHASERMREDSVDVVVLDEEFDAPNRGTATFKGEFDSMRMAERRRLIFVLISKNARTGDAHAAFLENANLVINTADVSGLPLVLERNVRDLNELYRDFNKAMNVAAI